MIIKCPSCLVRFIVPDNAIGSEGRKVKCNKCQNKWHQMPDTNISNVIPSIQNQAEINPVPENSNLPAIKKGKTSVLLKAVITILLVVNLIGLTIVYDEKILSIAPSMKNYYKAIGVYKSQDVALYNTSVEINEDSNTKQAIISGLVVNETDKELIMPSIKLVLYDKYNKKIQTLFWHVKDKTIKAKEKLPFKKLLENLNKESHHLSIDLGFHNDLNSI